MANALTDFTKKREFLVCLDSDGCVMNTVRIKHTTVMCPELIRVFGPLEHRPSEQFAAQVSEHSDTGVSAQSEQVIAQLRQEVEHLKTLVSAKDSHIDSLKQAMLLIEHRHTGDSSWWKFWKR